MRENMINRAALAIVVWFQCRATGRGRERGDLPGWVLITVMTAGLVFVIWTFLGNDLVRAFRQAVRRATNVGP